MDSESAVIHHQMEQTRTNLQDKLETLEQRVKDTVQHVTEAVNETVTTVTDAVHDTVGTVKESVQDTVDTVKDTLDLRQQVEQRPWGMFCGAVAVGFFGGRLLIQTQPVASSAPVYQSDPTKEPLSRLYQSTALPGARETTSRSTPLPPASTWNWWDSFAQEYRDEIDKVKGLAISTLGGLIGELVTQSAPPALKEHIQEVVDSVTRKLGGQPLEEPLLAPSSKTAKHNGACHEEMASL
jgi:ElaB/YqjD/DUF883 family membrane-anchored ribosome-binding protein